jgi:hypothetical protein
LDLWERSPVVAYSIGHANHMRKLITALGGTGLLSLTFVFAGCSDTSAVTDKREVSGPGGKTTITDKREVKQSGQNPPAAGTTNPTPPKD